MNLVVWVGVVALATAIAVGTVSVLTHRRMMRDGELPDEVSRAVREDLLEKVGDASTEQRMRIHLRAYWKDSGYTAAQRYVLLHPLLERKVLFASAPDEQPEAFFDFVAQQILRRPANWVILNSRDWQRLASGTSAGVVIKEISGSIVQIGNQNTATLTQDFTPEFVERLVGALRVDALSAVGASAERADSLADSLESDLAKRRWSSIGETVKTIASTVASGATIWAATAQILNA